MFFFVVACAVLLKTFQLLTSFSLPAQLSYIINESSLMQTAKFTERAGRQRQGLYEGSVSSGSREVSCSEQQHKGNVYVMEVYKPRDVSTLFL